MILYWVQEFHERSKNKYILYTASRNTSLSNKLNNFITFVWVCINTTKAFDFQSLGRPFVFSALACKVWCLSMLFKPPYVGLVLHPHHPLTLPQCSFSVQRCPLFGFHSCLQGSLVEWETPVAENSLVYSRVLFSARSDLSVQFYHMIAWYLDWTKGKSGRSEERWQPKSQQFSGNKCTSI